MRQVKRTMVFIKIVLMVFGFVLIISELYHWYLSVPIQVFKFVSPGGSTSVTVSRYHTPSISFRIEPSYNNESEQLTVDFNNHEPKHPIGKMYLGWSKDERHLSILLCNGSTPTIQRLSLANVVQGAIDSDLDSFRESDQDLNTELKEFIVTKKSGLPSETDWSLFCLLGDDKPFQEITEKGEKLFVRPRNKP